MSERQDDIHRDSIGAEPVAIPDLSVVICSVNPDNAERTRRNISETSGVDCEFIIVDNRERNWPIAKAYNYGARQATSPNLFFAHEDILFEKAGWARKLVSKLAEPGTGVIGFIGSQLRTGAYAPWAESIEFCIGHIYYYSGGYKEVWHRGMIPDEDFRRVLVVDGLGMAVPKSVWEAYPFDESMLTGFHCYDIDFCLTIGCNYSNYVYFGGDVNHLSNGNMDMRWAEATKCMTDRKWRHMLPMRIDEVGEINFRKLKADQDYDFLWRLVRQPDVYPTSFVNGFMKNFMEHSCKNKYYLGHLFVILWQYLIKRVF